MKGPGFMATPFTNQASLFYNGNIINSNITSGYIADTVAMTKTALTDTYEQNGKLTYVITVTNAGETPISNLSITDNLGEYTTQTGESYTPLSYVDGSVLYFVNGTVQPAPAVTAATALVISGISIPANGNAIIAYEAQINQYAPFGTAASITNNAVLSSIEKADIASASETITLADTAALSIVKVLSPDTVEEGGSVTYTFTIENRGAAAITPDDNVTLSDAFTPFLNNLSAVFNGTPWTEGTNYTYDDTGLFTTNDNQITVPAATYSQDAQTGVWTVTPGVSTLVISGTV